MLYGEQELISDVYSNPINWRLRNVLADYYEDVQEFHLSDLHRWIAANQKYPLFNYFGNRRWEWFGESTIFQVDKTHKIPNEIVKPFMYYSTHAEADKALLGLVKL